MARTYWTDEALQHIAEIYKYIANDSPQNAENFLNALMDSVETQLSLSVYVGRITPELRNPDKREIIYKKSGYYTPSAMTRKRLTSLRYNMAPSRSKMCPFITPVISRKHATKNRAQAKSFNRILHCII